MGFYTFAWDSFNLSFGSDILVIMYMGFVMVDLSDEWVYGFYKWWLSKACYGEDLGGLAL